ncbi:MFS transporter [Roseomonas sp. NAR14]|uniref:MFS transporter n=1 Tax=Roseomonas acroporae TaxID=2937791 RepID=A0A9X1Y3U9_9PROT|nr:MFS transporter [Roseomonas acroporae]MCK8783474.1 MFS transporter [Roseomonas acroporae]
MPVPGALGRALSHRNARVFFGASLTAWTGLWMHNIAVAWLAWELTRSAFWVGVVAFSDLFPAVVASPFAGAIADRVDRVRLTMSTQGATALQATLVAGLTLSGLMRIEWLIVLQLLGGVAQSFSQPARQSLLPGLVPPADLPAAIACNSLCFNVARFVGPAVAGPLIAFYGVVPAIACNAAAHLLAAASMPLMRVEPAARRGHPVHGSLLGEVAEGLRHTARHPGIGPLLLYAALMATLLRGVQEILPPFVERLFGRGAESLALLTGCIGLGALAAGLWVAQRGRLAGTTRLAVGAAAVQAVATAGFAATGWFPLGLACAALYGAMGSIHGICTQTLVQSASDPAMRGRILSLWGIIIRGCPALGAIVLGALGERFGLRVPTIAFALLALLVFAWRLRRLPAVAATLETPRAASTA